MHGAWAAGTTAGAAGTETAGTRWPARSTGTAGLHGGLAGTGWTLVHRLAGARLGRRAHRLAGARLRGLAGHGRTLLLLTQFGNQIGTGRNNGARGGLAGKGPRGGLADEGPLRLLRRAGAARARNPRIDVCARRRADWHTRSDTLKLLGSRRTGSAGREICGGAGGEVTGQWLTRAGENLAWPRAGGAGAGGT